MRTNEERITALHSRALQLKRQRKNQQFFAVCALTGAVCLGLLIEISSRMPDIADSRFIDGASDAMNASIFSSGSFLVYIVIAILAFLLGIIVTIFCFRLKKWLDEKDRGDL